MGFLMLPHPLINFEIQKCYKNEPRFDVLFSRNNLPKKIKAGTYIINLGEYADVGTHWIALFCEKKEIVYFDSFGVEHISEEIKEFLGKYKTYHFPNTRKRFKNLWLLLNRIY